VSEIRVTYHQEEGSWWAESPDVPGFSATAEDLVELRTLVREGLTFHLRVDSVDVRESLADDGIVASVVVTQVLTGATLSSSSQAASVSAYTVTAAPTSWLPAPLLQRMAS
jgi:predicted RNase H-like HicB family nuclease